MTSSTMGTMMLAPSNAAIFTDARAGDILMSVEGGNSIRFGLQTSNSALQVTSSNAAVSGGLVASNLSVAGLLTVGAGTTTTACNLNFTGTFQFPNAWQFSNNSSNVFLLGGSNIGIGKSNPSVAMDVVGTVNASVAVWQGGSNLSTVLAPIGTSSTAAFASNAAVLSSNLAFAQTWTWASSNATTACNVGIATITPTSRLDVVGGPMLVRNGNNSNASTSNQLLFGFANTTTYRHALNTRHQAATGSNAIDFMLWNTPQDLNAVGNNSALTVTPTGAGVLNNNPQYALDVTGVGHFASNMYANNVFLGDCGLGQGTTALAHELRATSNNVALLQTSTGATTLNASSNQAVSFAVAGVVQGGWTSNGLGVGSAAPAARVDVSGGNVRLNNLTTTAHMGIVLANASNQLAAVEQAAVSATLPNETILNIGQNTGWLVAGNPGADTAFFRADTRSTYRSMNWFAGLSNNNSNVIMTLQYPSGNLTLGGSNACIVCSNSSVAAPSIGVLGGAGDKFVLWPGSAGYHPYSIGVADSTLWSSVLAGGQHQYYVGGSVSMTLSNNRLGLGTPAPTQMVDVNGNVQLRNGGGYSATANYQLEFGYSNSASCRHAINSRHNGGGGATSAYNFLIWDSNLAPSAVGATNTMSVTPYGIGINNWGTTTPLDVVGKARFTGGIHGPMVGSLVLRAYDETAQTYDFRGKPIDCQMVSSVNWTTYAPSGQSTYFSSRVSGYFCPPATDTYTFQVYADEGCKIYINDRLMMSTGVGSYGWTVMPSVALTANVWYPILIEQVQSIGGNQLTLQWKGATTNTVYQTFAHGASGSSNMQLTCDLWESASATRLGRVITNGNVDVSGNITCSQAYKNYLLTGSVAAGGPSMYLSFAGGGSNDVTANAYTTALTGTYSTSGTTTTLNGKTVNYLSYTGTSTTQLLTTCPPAANAKTISYWTSNQRALSSTNEMQGVGFFPPGAVVTNGVNFQMQYGPSGYASDLCYMGFANDWAVGSNAVQPWANTGQWTHVAVTMDFTNMVQIFVNGQPVGRYYTANSLDYGTTPTVVNNPKFRGAATANNAFRIAPYYTNTTLGTVYGFRSILYYNRCLAHDEISALYYMT